MRAWLLLPLLLLSSFAARAADACPQLSQQYSLANLPSSFQLFAPQRQSSTRT